MIQYGLISKVDAACVEKTLDLIIAGFPEETINVCEVGLYNCATSHGVHDYILSKGRAAAMTGIDNERDKLIHPPGWMKFIRGNSNEVYNKVPDGSQHLIFIDGLHTFPAVVSDFFCYAPKVKVGGFIGFHDTGLHLDPLSGWQGIGSKDDPDMCLGGVRKALDVIGLLEQARDPYWGANERWTRFSRSWELVFDEADPEDTGGGICIFKRMY